MLLRATHHFMINLQRPGDAFSANPLYSAAERYRRSSYAHLTAIRHINPLQYTETTTGLHDLLLCELPKMKTR